MNTLQLATDVNFIAAAEGDATAPVRFTIEAYTGAPIRQSWSKEPIVIDLAGMQFKQVLPIVLGHDYTLGSILGQTSSVRVEGSKLIVEGEILASGDTADRVAQLARMGYQWQASVGADVRRHTRVDAERTVMANGQMFEGPIRIVKASALREVSFVTLGADADTRVSIAADIAETEELLMADHASETPAIEQPIVAEAPATVAVEATTTPPAVDVDSSIVAALTAKVEKMEKLLATRADRAPAVHVAEDVRNDRVIEAALCLQGGLPNVDRSFDARTLEAAHKAKRSTSIGEVLIEAARSNGYTGSNRISSGNTEQVLRAAFATNDIQNLLSNLANKFLLNGFNAVESVWQEISAVRSVNDFKSVNLLRLNGDMKFRKVGSNGELKVASVSDQKRSLSAETFGISSSLSRQDMINDDLSALSMIPQKMGRGAALAMNEAIWTEFQSSNASYYQAKTAAAGNALSLASLKSAVTAFRKLNDPDGNPLGIPPRVLLVPPELELVASELMASNLLIASGLSSTSAASLSGSTNVLAGRFRVVVSNYLSSDSTWWLTADAADLAALDVVFLNGQQSPTIEQVAPDYQVLGVAMRGYMDFGVQKAESLSCLRMATA
jgi:phage major head subunit gpT-like protein